MLHKNYEALSLGNTSIEVVNAVIEDLNGEIFKLLEVFIFDI
ncbi:hypothetical protein [Mammaliicoccus sciuri]|nr:hypothetical protein [Mammaliicoccus sciuri]